MPTYDYSCNDCDSTYDVFHKTREIKEDVVCPNCQSPNHTRLLSAPNVAVSGGSKSSMDFSSDASCDTGGCCGGRRLDSASGACGIN